MREQFFMSVLMVLASNPVLGQDRSINTSTLRPRQDCAPLEVARTADSDAYSAYASCIISNNYGVFHALYARHLRDFPNDTGDVEVRFDVGLDGRAENVEASSTKIKNSRLLQLIAARLKLIEFLPPDSKTQQVVHRFMFSQIEH